MRECDPKSVHKRRTVAKKEVKTNILLFLYRVLFLRDIVKWITRKVLGICELQRIIRRYKFAERNDNIHQCLLLSKHQILRDAVELKNLNEIPPFVSKILVIKHIIPETDPPFEETLTFALYQINGYRILFDEVETERQTAYDCDNPEHEEMLLKLWKLLKPDQELGERVCKAWGEIGFQGSDPKTDFRGMGCLGLKCMLYFAENYTQKAQRVLSHSRHPTQGYSYAIVSINITSLMYEMLQSGLLRSHFYSETQGKPGVSDFLDAFSCAFEKFDRFWIESKPENVMAFSRIRENFALEMAVYLSPPQYGSLKMSDA